MKSHFIYTCVITMLLLSTASLGEIIYDDNWNGYGSGSYGGDSGGSTILCEVYSDYSNEFATAEGWQEAYSDERAICDWYYYVYTYAEAILTLEYLSESCYAYASASAYAISDYTGMGDSYEEKDIGASVYVDETDAYYYQGVYLAFDGTYGSGCSTGYWDSGTPWFDPENNDYIYAEHTVMCVSVVYDGIMAGSHADAEAWITLED